MGYACELKNEVNSGESGEGGTTEQAKGEVDGVSNQYREAVDFFLKYPAMLDLQSSKRIKKHLKNTKTPATDNSEALQKINNINRI